MESHLLQMRGLKLNVALCRLAVVKSHLLQMRGLKPNSYIVFGLWIAVASFTDAWIETEYEP